MKNALFITTLMMLLPIWGPLSATAAGGANPNPSLKVEAEYYPNSKRMIALCDEEPKFIASSDFSPLVFFMNYESRLVQGYKSAWLEPNCSILLTNVNSGENRVIPYKNSSNPDSSYLESKRSLGNYLLSVPLLIWLHLDLLDDGKANSLADILTNGAGSEVYYYADFDLSRNFSPDERIEIRGLSPEQLHWQVPKEYFWLEAYKETFSRIEAYSEFGGAFVQIADFQEGPFDGRGLYVISILIEGK